MSSYKMATLKINNKENKMEKLEDIQYESIDRERVASALRIIPGAEVLVQKDEGYPGYRLSYLHSNGAITTTKEWDPLPGRSSNKFYRRMGSEVRVLIPVNYSPDKNLMEIIKESIGAVPLKKHTEEDCQRIKSMKYVISDVEKADLSFPFLMYFEKLGEFDQKISLQSQDPDVLSQVKAGTEKRHVGNVTTVYFRRKIK